MQVRTPRPSSIKFTKAIGKNAGSDLNTDRAEVQWLDRSEVYGWLKAIVYLEVLGNVERFALIEVAGIELEIPYNPEASRIFDLRP